MLQEDIVKFYEDKVTRLEAELEVLNNKINKIAAIRLFLFIGAIASAIYLYQWGITYSAISIAVFVIPFLIIVRIHAKIYDIRTHIQHLKLCNEEELLRMQGLGQFDEGKDFANPEHPYSADMDIFSDGGLFQYISRAVTNGGRQFLAQWLTTTTDTNTISLRQESIAELAGNTDWRQNWQASGRQLNEKGNELELLSEWAKTSPSSVNATFLKFIIYAFPVITISAWILSLWFVPVRAAVVLSTIQLSIVAAYTSRINNAYNVASKHFKALEKYSRLLILLEDKSFNSTQIKNIQAELEKGNRRPAEKLHKLSRVLEALEGRMNILSTIISNSLYMRDIHTAVRLEKWKSQYADEMPEWFRIVWEMDVLCSFGTFCFNQPGFVFPGIEQSGLLFQATELAHPLISYNKRIGNDVQINGWGSFMLVTGSNMGGKSTFLRTVGVNWVLAMAGAPVCANTCSFKPVSIYSSMRVGDSIRNSESTFYAELQRLKRMLDKLHDEESIFILLDEILRGTNSADKLTGSFALMRQLVQLKGAGIIATHDLPLAELETEFPDQIRNFNFEVQIAGDKFMFDYKLKPGVCKTMNAMALMKQMGIRINL